MFSGGERQVHACLVHSWALHFAAFKYTNKVTAEDTWCGLLRLVLGKTRVCCQLERESSSFQVMCVNTMLIWKWVAACCSSSHRLSLFWNYFVRSLSFSARSLIFLTCWVCLENIFNAVAHFILSFLGTHFLCCSFCTHGLVHLVCCCNQWIVTSNYSQRNWIQENGYLTAACVRRMFKRYMLDEKPKHVSAVHASLSLRHFCAFLENRLHL